MITEVVKPGREYVLCETCMKEISISAAIVPEASDYIAHFCGIECYDRWRQRFDNPATQGDILTRAAPL
jgi:hypothetical protein